MIFFVSRNILSYEPYQGTVKNFVGINSNVGAYDKGIISRLAKVALWMREYHRWEFYEQNPDIYGWDHTTPAFNGGSWPFHTKFVEECVKNNINMVICTERSTTWAASNGVWNNPPYGQKDGSKEEHYIDKAEFIAQQVARYGSKIIEKSKIETTDKKSGLNYVKYFEDENEPDQWWWQPTWPGNKYAKYLNAVHDGYNTTISEEYPLIGIKNVDPNAIHVLGGMTGGDLGYLDEILGNTDGRIPFDILNFHHYCSLFGTSQKGLCPEDENDGFKKTVDRWLVWRDKNTPGIPLWCTEFGWDTFKRDDGQSSYIYAGEQSQANYLLRSIFLLMGYGLDKGFIFFDTDPNSTDITQYSSSGIMTDSNNGTKPKISFYYLAAMQNLVAEYSFVKVDTYGEGDPALYSYLLKSPEHNKYCYVIWCRNPNSRYDDGTKMTDFVFSKPGIKNALCIEPVNNDEFGQEILVALDNAGQINSCVTIPAISETPVFLFIEFDSELSVNSKKKVINELKVRTFPNPFNSLLTVEYELETLSDVNLSVFDISGRLVTCISKKEPPGFFRQSFSFSSDNLSTGIYLVHLETKDHIARQKICHIK